MITGYLHLDYINLLAPYIYEKGVLTVFTNNSFKADSENINIPPKLIYKSELKYLVGNITKTGKTIVFFTENLPFDNGFFGKKEIILAGTSTDVKVYQHLILENNDTHFNSMIMSCEELNHFYTTNHGIEQSFSFEEKTKRTITIKDVNETVSKFNFKINNVDVNGSFFVGHTQRTKSKKPLELVTKLKLEFDDTNDIDFIFSIYACVKTFISVVCYRSNITFGNISLPTKALHSITKKEVPISNSFFINGELDDIADYSDKLLIRTPDYYILKSHLSEFFQLIADEKIYTQHLPSNYAENSQYTIGRMILMTAAFEWNANEFLNITAISSNREIVVNDILELIPDDFSETKKYNKNLRKNFKFVLELIESSKLSLSNKIQYSLEEYKNVLTPFINQVYSLNDLDTDFEKLKDVMSSRVERHRNMFAHGNIEKEIYPEIVIDLIVLQWLVYCIFLSEIGYSKREIFVIINSIFNRNIHTNDYFKELSKVVIRDITYTKTDETFYVNTIDSELIKEFSSPVLEESLEKLKSVGWSLCGKVNRSDDVTVDMLIKDNQYIAVWEDEL